MRFNRVLLATCPVKADQGSLRPNIGLGYLSQTLDDNRIANEVIDMMLGYSFEDLVNKIKLFKPDLLGFNIFSNKYRTAYEVINNIKIVFPELIVIIGGPHISCLKSKVLEDCSGLDYGVILEGENALLELCSGKELKDIKNLIFRDNGQIKENEIREFVNDLDTISFPKYDKFEMEKYIREKSLVSSRGCPFNCTYCAVGKVIGKKVRVRTPENVVDEIEYWYRKGFRQFSFQDDNFNYHKERIFNICNQLEKRDLKEIFLRCAGARADKLDFELLKRMKEVGFKTIAIGVEGGNDKILKVLRKGEKFDVIDNAVKTACELGYDVYLNFLLGSPEETPSDVEDSVRFALKYPIFYAEWSNIIPYPGTELYDWLKERNYLIKPPEEYLNFNSTVSNDPVFETPEMSIKVRKQLLKKTKGIKDKILKRAIIRRLKNRSIPWGIRHIMGYIVASNIVSKLLFKNKLRFIADKARFLLYMKTNKING